MRSLQTPAAAESRGPARTVANPAVGDSVAAPLRGALGLAELRRVFKVQFDQLESQGYFQQYLGCSRNDSGVVPANGWPVQSTIAAWSEEDLFAMLKFLHDHVSKPKRRPRDGLTRGAWRYLEFDRDAGRAQFRKTINRALGVYRCGFELLERGDIAARSRDERQRLE